PDGGPAHLHRGGPGPRAAGHPGRGAAGGGRLRDLVPRPATHVCGSPEASPRRRRMTGPPDIPITRNGLEEVRRELQELTTVRRPEIVAKIKAAREHGDLSENFEYHAARNE